MTERGTHAPEFAPNLEAAWEMLQTQGWVLISDKNRDLGLDPSFRPYVLKHYFNKRGLLQPETYDVKPYDRLRARDVVKFNWRNLDEPLTEDDSTTIAPKDYSSQARTYKRTELVHDKRFNRWLEAQSMLMPGVSHHPTIEENPIHIGVNLFRTFTDVVNSPHRDSTGFVSVFVVDKHGEGATSELYREGSQTPFLRHPLQPGQELVFDDTQFLHSATPLIPASDGKAHRDTIICTYDFHRWPDPAYQNILTKLNLDTPRN